MIDTVVVIGPGQIGQAIARRVGVAKHLLLADKHEQNANAAAQTLSNAGYDVTTTTVDVSSREAVEALVAEAKKFGDITGLIHAAGVSPSQASPETILKVDLYGTPLVLDTFGKVIAEGGIGVVIASQSGHRLAPLAVGSAVSLVARDLSGRLAVAGHLPDDKICQANRVPNEEKDSCCVW